jgi:hypothetical protein
VSRVDETTEEAPDIDELRKNLKLKKISILKPLVRKIFKKRRSLNQCHKMEKMLKNKFP